MNVFVLPTAFFAFLMLVFVGDKPVVAQENTNSKFTTIKRPGSVDLEKEYDLSGILIPQQQIHRLLEKDRIPSLTDPKTENAKDSAEWLQPTSRLIEVKIEDEVIGVPLQILDKHEIVNLTVAGEPIAVTYCPLCDSATVFSRRVNTSSDGTVVLEFGVSGALYNSNVLMYDRTHNGLWSQLGMKSVSGPLVGTSLAILPVKMATYKDFLKTHPDASMVSRETTYQRDYTVSSYANYFRNDRLAVPVMEIGDALPRKTLGAGIVVGDTSYFVSTDAIGKNGYTLQTESGEVVLTRSTAGVIVESKPDAVLVAQSFYYSWSAFYPSTKVISE